MRIDPCLDTIYKGLPTKEALENVKKNGLEGFEIWFYRNYDLSELAEEAERLGLETVNMNNEGVSLADSRMRGEFIEELLKTVRAAKQINCRRITVLSGNDTGEERWEQRASIVAGLREAAKIGEAEDIQIVIEASNRRVNRPQNYLTSADEAFSIIDEVGNPHVKMLYDIYHQQISEGDLLSRILPNLDKIGHFHAAGVPGRHELHLCEINYQYMIQKIKEAGYEGWMGLEYFPALNPDVGLNVLKSYL